MRTFMKRIVAALRLRVTALKSLRRAEQQIYLEALQKQQAGKDIKIKKAQPEPALRAQEQHTHAAG